MSTRSFSETSFRLLTRGNHPDESLHSSRRIFVTSRTFALDRTIEDFSASGTLLVWQFGRFSTGCFPQFSHALRPRRFPDG